MACEVAVTVYYHLSDVLHVRSGKDVLAVLEEATNEIKKAEKEGVDYWGSVVSYSILTRAFDDRIILKSHYHESIYYPKNVRSKHYFTDRFAVIVGKRSRASDLYRELFPATPPSIYTSELLARAVEKIGLTEFESIRTFLKEFSSLSPSKREKLAKDDAKLKKFAAFAFCP